MGTAWLACGAALWVPATATATIGTGQPIADSMLAPHVITGAAANVTRSSATLTAYVDPNFQATTVRFSWGAVGSTRSNIVTVPGTIGGPTDAPGSELVPVTATISDLTPSSSYLVAADATNAQGLTQGTEVTFTTLAPLDRTPPSVQLKVVPRSRAKVLSSGIRVRVTMNEAGGVSSAVRDGKRVLLSRNATGTGFTREAGDVSAFIELTARAKARIRSNPRIRWTIAVTATDGAGNTTVATVPFRLG